MSRELLFSVLVILAAVHAVRLSGRRLVPTLAAAVALPFVLVLVSSAGPASIRAWASVLPFGIAAAAAVGGWPRGPRRPPRELGGLIVLLGALLLVWVQSVVRGTPAPAGAAGWAALLAAFLLLAEPATRVVRVVVGLLGDSARPILDPEPRGDDDLPGAGEWIGIMERWILFVLVARAEYSALGFVIAAKALARHRQMEVPRFAEYFLVGTLTSVAIAIAVGELFRWSAVAGGWFGLR